MKMRLSKFKCRLFDDCGTEMHCIKDNDIDRMESRIKKALRKLR
jgi:hypothetical protein